MDANSSKSRPVLFLVLQPTNRSINQSCLDSGFSSVRKQIFFKDFSLTWFHSKDLFELPCHIGKSPSYRPSHVFVTARFSSNECRVVGTSTFQPVVFTGPRTGGRHPLNAGNILVPAQSFGALSYSTHSTIAYTFKSFQETLPTRSDTCIFSGPPKLTACQCKATKVYQQRGVDHDRR